MTTKDDTSTPITDESAPNEFERDKPGTSARTDAEDAIEELRQRGGVFVNAVRATRMPMALTDPNLPGNPIVFANSSFLKLSGYSMDEVLGQQPHFMNGPGTDPKDARRFEEAIRSDQDDIIETVQYRKGGGRFVATVLISAFKDQRGRTLNHFMSWLDVTRRVEAEEEVADLKSVQRALRISEDRQAFLLELGDAIRAEAIAEAKIEAAARMLGERLKASRVLWAEYDWEADLAHMFNGWFADGAQPFPMTLHLADFDGEVLNKLKAGETVRVDNVGALIEEPAYAAIANVGVQALLSPPLLVNGKLKVNLSIHQHEPRHWTNDEVALVEEVCDRLWAEVVRARTAQALRESEEKYAALFAASPAPFLILRPDAPHFTILDVNAAYLAATLRTRENLVGREMFDAFPDNPDDPAADGESALRASLEHAAISRRPDVMKVQKYDIARPDGTFEERWWKPVNSPVVDDKGNVAAIIHNVVDVTAEHRAAEALRESHAHQQSLLAELQHRVRNTLAIVRSIAQRTAENSNSVEGMLSHFRGRLDAFSRVQTALTRGVSGTVSLITLIEDELVAHAAREGEQVSIEGPEIMLEVKTAERLSLAIHELTTNAVKHGALTSDKGRIRISWKREQATGSARLLLNWKESGVEVEENPEREGFGMELLLRSLPYDVQGETKVALHRHGLEFDLSMPLREPVEIK